MMKTAFSKEWWSHNHPYGAGSWDAGALREFCTRPVSAQHTVHTPKAHVHTCIYTPWSVCVSEASTHTRVCTHTDINTYTYTDDDATFHSPFLSTPLAAHTDCSAPVSGAWNRVLEAGAGMWSHAGVQRDTDTKVLHIHLMELAVYFPLTANRYVHYRQPSHILRDKSFCFTRQNTCWSLDRKRQLKMELSFVSWSIALPRSMLSAIELQIGFFIILIHQS